MVTLLAKIFIKDSEDKIKQREAYGMLRLSLIHI